MPSLHFPPNFHQSPRGMQINSASMDDRLWRTALDQAPSPSVSQPTQPIGLDAHTALHSPLPNEIGTELSLFMATSYDLETGQVRKRSCSCRPWMWLLPLGLLGLSLGLLAYAVQVDARPSWSRLQSTTASTSLVFFAVGICSTRR